MSARSAAAVAELDQAVALLEQNAAGNGIPKALAEHLKAQAAYWRGGWFPVSPARLDVAVARLAKAVIATYAPPVTDLPAADAGICQHTTTTPKGKPMKTTEPKMKGQS